VLARGTITSVDLGVGLRHIGSTLLQVCLCEDYIKMDLQEVGCGSMEWIGLAQDKDSWWTLVNVVMSFRVPQNAENFLTS
jgi:hypothetical protein